MTSWRPSHPAPAEADHRSDSVSVDAARLELMLTELPSIKPVWPAIRRPVKEGRPAVPRGQQSKSLVKASPNDKDARYSRPHVLIRIVAPLFARIVALHGRRPI